MLSSATQLVEIILVKPNAISGISLKLFGFIAEPVFTFIPESCSRSSRNTVRNHPGIAYTLPRIPHSDDQKHSKGSAGLSRPAQVRRQCIDNDERLRGAAVAK